MWGLLLRPLMGWYYHRSYQPQLLPDDFDPPPPSYRLSNVTWLASRNLACVTSSMQMIAAHFGIEHSRRTFDFLMGFTYGAGELPGYGYSPVGTDPETGFIEAAPYLGLKCRYMISDDPTRYLLGIRHYLSQRIPVRLPLDMGILYSTIDPILHSEVLIGYDEAGFEYYEPVCRPPASCQPAVHRPGDEGCWVSDERLLAAVQGQSRLFHYPWQYALSIFEPGSVSGDWPAVWQRNGRNLIGGQQMGMRWGARATKHLASQMAKDGQRLDAAKLKLILEMGAFMRHENALFLGEIAGSERSLLLAAGLFEKSAQAFRCAFNTLSQGAAEPGYFQGLADCLSQVATAEIEAGEIFLALKNPGDINLLLAN